MLKIRGIKIIVTTASNKQFGAEYIFRKGLNVIRGDNTAGKSTLFQCILFGLGMEELLDGRNERPMQSVLKDYITDGEVRHTVVESTVYLEIESSSIITLRRSIVSPTKKPKLIEVIEGPIITNPEESILNITPMYVHDKGGASDGTYGFHSFLEDFLGWSLPDVVSTNGETRKLYLQTIFPAFVIEQKKGWSDFLATIPYYGIREAQARAIEFILNLDVITNKQLKQELDLIKLDITSRWNNLYNNLLSNAKRGAIQLNGIHSMPEIIDNNTPISITIENEGIRYSLAEYLDTLKNRLSFMLIQPVSNTGSNTKANEVTLQETQGRLSEISVKINILLNELSLGKVKLSQYRHQLRDLLEDIEKNKGAKKVYNLGAEAGLDLALNVCPTCHQDIKDTLLPQDLTQIPMGLDDNISYLEAQKRMIELHIDIQQKNIYEADDLYTRLNKDAVELRQQIRTLKSELISDERIPSEVEIERRIKLRSLIDFYSKSLDQIRLDIENFKELSKEWLDYLSKVSNRTNDFFSLIDKRKLQNLEDNFKQLLFQFRYSSKPANAIQVSRDSYLPVIQSEVVRYNIRTDSSASDLIRAIWAYSCSLIKVSKGFSTNHPKLLLFDEPAQHSISNEDFKSFLTELATYTFGQVLVFASFNQSDEDFNSTTKGINFNLVRIKDRLIKPL